MSGDDQNDACHGGYQAHSRSRTQIADAVGAGGLWVGYN